MGQKGRFWKSREERQREADERYSEQMQYKKRIMREQEKWAERLQGYPDIQIFFRQITKWQIVLFYLGITTFLVCILGHYVNGTEGIYRLLPIVIWIGLTTYFNHPVKVPYGIFVSLVVVVVLNLLPFWYYELGDSSFGGFLAGVGALLLKAGVSLPEAMEDYTFYILWMYGIGFIVRGVIVTVYYLLAGIFVVKLMLPKSREIFKRLDRIGSVSRKAKGRQEDEQQEILSEKRPMETSGQEYTKKQNDRISKRNKFMEIYEEHPDIGRYMQKRCADIQKDVLMGLIFHGFWIYTMAWELSVRTWFFSLMGFAVIAVAMFACMSEKPERAYILFGVTVAVIGLNLLPFVHDFMGDTVIYFVFYSIYVMCSSLFALVSGLPLNAWAGYEYGSGSTEALACGFIAGTFYLWAFIAAVKMLRPKEMNMVKKLKELSDNWHE